MNSGVKLWNKAKHLIPGGNQLLSKRSELFLPDQWPSYYKKAKGVEIWDLNDNHYYDLSIMGVGCCILGYSDDTVDSAVIESIRSGSMSTLNPPEEVELAEKLLSSDKWAGMVRYARTGGEAMTIAVRIARAFSKKEKIAFSGYHGWHDWYLSANIADSSNLDSQLLTGLSTAGVPQSLRNTAIPFHYNNIAELEDILKTNDIGVIVVETIRSSNPKDNFLKKVRTLAIEHNAVLIFDEITSGFRLNVGGAYKQFGTNPDIVVYAKALGNGFPMAAIVGKQEVMDSAQDSFISSTYWTDKIGPTAALTTLKLMEERKVQPHMIEIGNYINVGWKKLADEHSINLTISGIPPLTHFTIEEENSQALRTIFTQKLLELGFLASNSVYVSHKHTKEIVDSYMVGVDTAFHEITKAKSNGYKNYLKGPIAHSGFQRLA